MHIGIMKGCFGVTAQLPRSSWRSPQNLATVERAFHKRWLSAILSILKRGPGESRMNPKSIWNQSGINPD